MLSPSSCQWRCSVWWLCLLWLGSLATPALAAGRTTYNFNPGWRVLVGDPAEAATSTFDDKGWKAVTLPYAWNEDEAFSKDIKDLSTGVAWYRKHFRLPAGAAGQRVVIEFEGVRLAGEFYLNGHALGRHENGVMAVGYDLTPFLQPAGQDNVLAVCTDNDWDYKEKATGQAYQWSNRNFNANYGGIPKNVRLHLMDSLHQTLPLFSALGTTGVYVYAQGFDVAAGRATVVAEAQVKNEGVGPRTFRFEATVADNEGKIIGTLRGGETSLPPGQTATVRARAPLAGLHFWSWGYGYLYTVSTRLVIDNKVVDEVKTRTGFRKTEFAGGLIRLNDRVMQVHGYAQRTSNEWPAVGLGVPAWLSDYSNGLMVSGNANLVRWMHVTPWKQDIESCDRVGLPQAMPAGDAEKDVADRRWGQRLELMRDAIIYNRNNPSILFYECGNESISAAHMQELKDIRDQYDPHGGRAIGSREMLDIAQAEYGGEMLYINKSAGKPLWAMEYSRDEALRKYWDELTPPYHKDGAGPPYKGASAAEYNRNQDSQAREDVMRWYDYWHERPGTGTRSSAGGVNIVFSDTNTHYRGEENYRRSGEVDALRIAKDGFFAHQVMWDGWVEPEHSRTHIIGHWNYAAGVVKNVDVVSNGEKVKLFLNGKSLGFGQQSHRFLFTFKDVAWQPGTLRAVSYDAAGKSVSEAEHQTAGPAVSLRLTPMTGPAGLHADGADLALVQVEAVDAQGHRCPTALNLVSFSLSGPAEWRGGLAQGPGNYVLSKALPVEGGANRVLIRTTTQAGTIGLTATADGLKPAAIKLKSQPVLVQHGLATQLPGADLPARLDRGPTPAGPSYVVSRVAVPIVAVTASSNAANAAFSFDDNELSEWISGRRDAQPWIEYALARPAAISQVALKLTGWRTSTYPLRILVDGQEVFRGTSERSLGYFTAVFPARTGQRLRIELAGKTQAKDAFNIMELETPKVPTAATDQPGPPGTLGLVEVEVYEKPAAAPTP
ncbi:glycoside hydrolase family 2 protein [Hymenobacter sp. UV11]|uniref:glycoside hydrolase family 2 protein n=1 Tax=Hymenobacter sp. UV11 TaxID=1849735 RepID=UPI0010614C52|nr:sugar-binding domain-containing protein [Hymenobacter sp. UV11]TDN35883.1 beta-galactosidase [Hymenobacter sp. UV11]TFZ68314.1 glycoside hydrolase family 2 protein [Hymenobacter sp. UV11]